jgi:hypothetical protein
MKLEKIIAGICTVAGLAGQAYGEYKGNPKPVSNEELVGTLLMGGTVLAAVYGFCRYMEYKDKKNKDKEK